MADDPNPNAVADPPEAGAWRDSLPDDLKDSKVLSTYDSVEDLTRAYVDQQPLIGSKVILPGENATDEERESFFNQLGRPETVDGYKVPADGLPEGFKIDEDQQKAFFEFAHEHGFTANQAAAAVRFDAIRMATSAKAQKDQQEADLTTATEAMKKEWGGSYDEKMALAKGAISKFGGDDLVQALEETGLGNHPAMIKAFAVVGKAIAQDEILGAGAARSFISSPAEADAKMKALRADPDFMKRFHSSSSVERKDAVAEMDALMQIKFPNERKS